MVVDTSALLALLLQEEEAEAILELACAGAPLHLSAATRLELTLVTEAPARQSSAGAAESPCQSAVDQLLLELGLEVVPFDAGQLHWALQGWRRYGQGRQRDGLNLGDCFSYALAMALDEPLLCTDTAFRHTDVRMAIL
jgi:ribonuclease VapC